MGKHRKSRSVEENAKIVKYYQESGAAKACKEFNVSSAALSIVCALAQKLASNNNENCSFMG